MAYTATRQTLFGVISGIENDLKNIIFNELNERKQPSEILGADLFPRACSRLEKDFGPLTIDITLRDILHYVDLGDLYQIINRNSSLIPKEISSYIRTVTSDFEKIVPIRNRVAHSRPLLVDDFSRIWDIANGLLNSKLKLWPELSYVFNKIQEDPSFALAIQLPGEKNDNLIAHNLPSTDFDETGFIGRNEVVSQLIGLCKGPYPVITIVGEGGIGKTSLALKVAYDLMDSPDKPFDAIVWTTAKTQQLTAGHIKEIDNAIRSSLGMFESISGQLGGVSSDPIPEVLAYLKEFKILLILDNLETVIDARVSNFMSNIPLGTKILITSRIGLGAFEFPVKLPPLSEIEAVQLVRTLARMRGVTVLTNVSNDKLAKYCRKMKNNPGYIKWFVSAIQAGQRPETVLDNPDIFLEFCMSNVYEYLNKNSKLVLKSMQAVRGRQSQAEIGYLNSGMDVIELQRALQQLLTTNMVSMSSVERGAAFESTYDISELARAYLDRHHPLASQEMLDFSKRRRQLASVGERLAADRRGNPYSIKTINMRSRSDVVIAKYLYDIIKNSLDKRNIEESARMIEEARRLAPDYYEVHRVEAFFLVTKGSYSAAKISYEAALELEPNSAALHYWYGGFLMRYLDDTEAALSEFDKAYKIDPNSYQIQLELARVNLYLKRYSDAIQKINLLLNRHDVPEPDMRKVYDLHLQYYARYAEYLVDFERENLVALELLESMIKAYNELPKHLIDAKTVENIKKAFPTARKCLYHLDNIADYKERANDVFEWIQHL